VFRTLISSIRQLALIVPFALIATTLALGVAPASAKEPRTLTIVLTEYKFSPDSITLTAGQPVQLNIQNQGKADHNLSSDDLPLMNINYVKADNSTQDLSRYVSTNVLNADALSGHTSVVTFTPTTAGTFGFFSEDEESLGMVGKFIVLAPGVQAPAPAPSTSAAPVASTTTARDGQGLSTQSAANASHVRGSLG